MAARISSEVGVFGGRVYTNRALPLSHLSGSGQLPAVNITTAREEGSRFNESAAEFQRDVTVSVEVYVRATGSDADVDDELDDILELVYVAIMSDQKVGGTAGRQLDYLGTDFGTDSESEWVLGMARMNFQVSYLSETPPAVPDGQVEDLTGVDVSVTAAGDGGSIDGELDY